MAVKIRRSYKGAASSALLSAGVSSTTQTSIALTTSPSNWPTGKFFVVVAPGTAQEEKMCVTLSGDTLTVVSPSNTSTAADEAGRGVDNTTARTIIAANAIVYPVFTAIDADEANELASTYANQGGMVYQGASTFTQLAIGTAGRALKVNSTATAPEWGQLTADGIADSAITSAKILDGTIVLADLAASLQAFLVPVGTINAYAGATAPTGWLLCDGTTSTSGYTALAALVGATTPDLRGKFLMGKTATGTGSNLLGSGGSATIAEGNLPSHIHGVGTLDIAVGGSHTHTASTAATGTHNHSAGSLKLAHTHSLSGYYNNSTTHSHPSSGNVSNAPSGSSALGSIVTGAASTDSVTGATATDGSHSHTVTVDAAADHDHSISGSTGATGSGTDYYQPFVAVSYIIKHD